jgi:hypothetical protein
MSRRTPLALLTLPLAIIAATACTAERRPPPVAGAACFGTRVLSFADLRAEVFIPAAESCEHGTFSVIFTRGADTVATLAEARDGTVGFIGIADLDADGRGEFFVATHGADSAARGNLFGYSDRGGTIERLAIAPLDSAQMVGYAGHDRFGFGGADQLVRAFPRVGADTAWFAYAAAERRWRAISRPNWVR